MHRAGLPGLTCADHAAGIACETAAVYEAMGDTPFAPAARIEG